MHSTQMLLALLAIILLSTTMLISFNSTADQLDIAYKNMSRNQGLRVVDKYLQKIDADHISGLLAFSDIINVYGNYTDNINVNGTRFTINIRTAQCDNTGDTSSPNVHYNRVDVRVVCRYSPSEQLAIGTANHPISKIYSDAGW